MRRVKHLKYTLLSDYRGLYEPPYAEEQFGGDAYTKSGAAGIIIIDEADRYHLDSVVEFSVVMK